MLKRIYDKIVLMYAIFKADRVVLITLKKCEFKNYLSGEFYQTSIMYNSMVADNAKEIISNLADKVDKKELLSARNNYWGVDID